MDVANRGYILDEQVPFLSLFVVSFSSESAQKSFFQSFICLSLQSLQQYNLCCGLIHGAEGGIGLACRFLKHVFKHLFVAFFPPLFYAKYPL